MDRETKKIAILAAWIGGLCSIFAAFIGILPYFLEKYSYYNSTQNLGLVYTPLPTIFLMPQSKPTVVYTLIPTPLPLFKTNNNLEEFVASDDKQREDTEGPPTPAPPRYLAWSEIIVTSNLTKLFPSVKSRDYDSRPGDRFEYWSPRPFIMTDGDRELVHNKCGKGEIRSFKF